MSDFRCHWRDPIFRVLLVVCVGLFLALVSFHFLMYASTSERASRLETNLKKLEEEYAYQHEIGRQVEAVNKATPVLDETIEKLNRTFSTVAFSGDLDGFVDSSGVSLLAQSYDDPKSVEDYSFVHVQVRLMADYPALRKFIQSLERGRFYVVITKAKLERKDNKIIADVDFEVRYLEDRNGSEEV